MRLKEWARRKDLSYQTAWNLWKSGRLPGAYKLGGSIFVAEQNGQPQHEVDIKKILCHLQEAIRNISEAINEFDPNRNDHPK